MELLAVLAADMQVLHVLATDLVADAGAAADLLAAGPVGVHPNIPDSWQF